MAPDAVQTVKPMVYDYGRSMFATLGPRRHCWITCQAHGVSAKQWIRASMRSGMSPVEL